MPSVAVRSDVPACSYVPVCSGVAVRQSKAMEAGFGSFLLDRKHWPTVQAMAVATKAAIHPKLLVRRGGFACSPTGSVAWGV